MIEAVVVLFLAVLMHWGEGALALASTASSSSAPWTTSNNNKKDGSPAVLLSSLVTGGNGYVGRAILHEILRQDDEERRRRHPQQQRQQQHRVVSLVRPARVASEQAYWDTFRKDQQKDQQQEGEPEEGEADIVPVLVLPYDMLDDGSSLQSALDDGVLVSPDDGAATRTTRTVVYHTAAVFGPTNNHRQTALDNVRGTETLVRTLAAARDKVASCGEDDDNSNSGPHNSDAPTSRHHLVFTSSMAAVRATGQAPGNGLYYTADDWNTLSQLGANWGESYQWSKAASERRAGELCHQLGLSLTCLCPSFVFGPPTGGGLSGSYSLELVGKWVRGETPVQSRLFVDVRDVARAHVAAAAASAATSKCDAVATNRRYIVSTEARVPSHDVAEWLREACRNHFRTEDPLGHSQDPDRIHSDDDFQGGSVPIGAKEVEASNRLREELGVELRPVRETIIEMAEVLLRESSGVSC